MTEDSQCPKIISYRGVWPCTGVDYDLMPSDQVCFTNTENNSTGMMDMFYFNVKYKDTGTQWNGEEVYQRKDSNIKLPKRNDGIEDLIQCAEDIRWMSSEILKFDNGVRDYYHGLVKQMYKDTSNDVVQGKLIQKIHQKYNCCYEKAMQYNIEKQQAFDRR